MFSHTTILSYDCVSGIPGAVHYGAWCIYLDAGSSNILVEGNVCYATDDTILNQNFGRENLIRANVFGPGAEAIVSHGMAHRTHTAFRLQRNILISDGEAFFRANSHEGIEHPNHESDLNILDTAEGRDPEFRNRRGDLIVGIREWQARGQDRHSTVVPGSRSDGASLRTLEGILKVVGELHRSGILQGVGLGLSELTIVNNRTGARTPA